MIGTEKLSLKQRDGRAGPGRAAILISHRPNYKTLSLRSLVITPNLAHKSLYIKYKGSIFKIIIFIYTLAEYFDALS